MQFFLSALAFFEPSILAEAFGRATNLPSERVFTGRTMKAVVAPTLVVVDAGGVVEYVREGVLSQDDHARLTKLLGVPDLGLPLLR